MPQVEALRAQARATTASPWCDCGCPSLQLTIDPARAPRTVAFRRDVESLVSEAVAKEGSPSHPSWIGLFVHDGWLAILELADMDDDGTPNTFPPVADLMPPMPR